MTLKLIIIIILLIYLVKELLMIDNIYDKVYYLPTLLLSTAKAFIVSFIIMWLFEQTLLTNWAGVAAVSVFTYLQVLFLKQIIKKDNDYFKNKRDRIK